MLTFGKTTLSDGTLSYDKDVLAPELAEAWEVAPDGMSITFQLRPDARFHDGRPVTAKDVKWSFDRAVTVGGFPTFQMKAGSLERPDQFVVVNDHTFRVNLLRKDKMTLPDLAVPVAIVINSELAKQHATADDPWAMEFLKANAAGGGAFKVESWRPGTEIILSRFDDWKSGPLPPLRRIIWRDVPSAGSRLALMERGDADISYGVQPKDAKEIVTGRRGRGKLRVVGVPIPNAVWYLGMNAKNPPFSDAKVRQAVAYALPYEQLMQAAIYDRAMPMYGASADQPTTPAWPQPFSYETNIDRAQQRLVDVPRIPLCQPLLDVAMQANITNYQFWFHFAHRSRLSSDFHRWRVAAGLLHRAAVSLRVLLSAGMGSGPLWTSGLLLDSASAPHRFFHHR